MQNKSSTNKKNTEEKKKTLREKRNIKEVLGQKPKILKNVNTR